MNNSIKEVAALYKANKFEEALSLCCQIIDCEGFTAELGEQKALILKKLERPEEAIQALDEVILFLPLNPKPLFKKARWLIDLQRYDEALKCLETVLDLDDGYFKDSVYFFMAEINNILGIYDKAKSQIDMVPDHIEFRYIFGHKIRKACDLKEDIYSKYRKQNMKPV